MANANLVIFVNSTSLTRIPTFKPILAQVGNTYTFSIRDTIMLIFHTSATNPAYFSDLASIEFKYYLGPKTLELSDDFTEIKKK